MPQEITSLSHFNALKASPLLIIDFYATWCGPCKAISPVFQRLAKQHESPSSIEFAQVDVDKAKDVASTCGISAMPTFQFFKNGVKIDEVRGADVQQLTTKIGYYASGVAKSGGSGAKTPAASSAKTSGPGSLRSLIDVDASRLLHTTLLSNVRNIVQPPPKGYAVASTGGAKMLIHLVFKQTITPSHLKLVIPSDSSSNAPARIQIGVNVPVRITKDADGVVSNDLEMDSVKKAEKSQSFNVYSDEYNGGKTDLKLKASVFTNIKSMTIRIDINLSGDEASSTKIGEMDIIGVTP